MLIESFQNEKVKNITKLLTDNRFRKKSEVFVVEGQQENEFYLSVILSEKYFHIYKIQ